MSTEHSQPNLRPAAIRDVHFGANVSVVEPTNLYGCTIGDGSRIGPFVEIQRGARIGARCKVQSHSSSIDARLEARLADAIAAALGDDRHNQRGADAP